MLHFLLEKIPACIVAEIALFEGRVLRAYLRDDLCQVYVKVYKRYFWHRYTLITICGGLNFDTYNPLPEGWVEKKPSYSPIHGTMGSLPFYCTWSMAIRQIHPEFVKERVPRKHMRPYLGLVPIKSLIRERYALAARLAHYMNYTGCKMSKFRFRE